MKDFVKNNRQKIFKLLNEGEAAVFFSGKAPKKTGDENYLYTPDRNFYYLTGLGEPEIALLIYKGSVSKGEILFLTLPDEEEEKWTGAVLKKDEAEELSGISDISYTYCFYKQIGDIFFRNRINKVYLDLEKRGFDDGSPALGFAEKLKLGYPYIETADIYYFMADLRSVKSEIEIKNIKKAIDITKDGIYSMMKNSSPGMYEYEIEAYFDFELKRAGVFDKAFSSIIASGKNGCVLHYSKNRAKTKAGELLLCDVGATYNFYSGDITRTFPVGGHFTPRQRDIYNIVYEGNLMIQDKICAGIPFGSLNEELINFYAKELKAIGLISFKEDVKKYYWHGVSHLLGLETHDAGRHNEGLLREGMVLTVEPGLYIADEAIGIRIEDDVLVRKNDSLNLSADIIKKAEDIEEFMK